MSLTTLAEARRCAADAAALLRGPAAQAPMHECLGAMLAEDVHAPQPIPHATTSAMDGWAVRGAGPWLLIPEAPEPRTGRTALSPADQRPALRVGEAVAVVTGSPIPRGTTSVLRSEHGSLRPDAGAPGRELLHARSDTVDLEPGRHLRPAGSEAAAGDLLLRAGATVTPAVAAMAAVAGHDTLRIHPRPRVRLICTGEEVITSGLPGPGQVRDAFEISVPAAVEAMGGATEGVERVGDAVEALISSLQEGLASRADLLLTTGGTARSEADALLPALRSLGAELLVDGVDMRPGHPMVLARVGGSLVLGLPGNPLAGHAALAGIGQVILDVLAGADPRDAVGMTKTIAVEPLPGARRGQRLLPVERRSAGVAPVGHDSPHMMRGFAVAAAFALVPPEGVAAGETVEVLPLAWHAGGTRSTGGPRGRRSSSWDG
ncbi:MULTISPECIES: molybdopterin molybdotransferase MoeA [Actinomycetes]|uniref:Molybdopterin molybdenumtransferase n=2 Tax=Actinomycetes TaxID=1760 RepID=A0ABP6LST0_9MICC